MNPIVAVMKRELKSYFGTPLAYVFLALFLGVSAGWMFMEDFFLRGEASMGLFFQNLNWIFAFFAPLISMRMWAEERRTGTIELLLTLPITTRQAVLGKFLAAWAFMGIALLLTLPVFLTIVWLGDPEIGPTISGYFGAFLVGGSYLAISGFFSALTKSQVISCVLAVITCVVLILIGNPSFLNMLGEGMGRFAESLSFTTQFDTMQRGIVELRNILFMVVMTLGFLAASIVMLEDRKAA